MDAPVLTVGVGLSLGLQITAAVQALRLIRLTGRYRAWLLVVAALAFMAFRRATVLLALLSQDGAVSQAGLLEEMIALATSALMAGGITLIRPVFLDLKLSQERLRASQERYRSIFTGSQDGILVFAPGGEILAMNPAAGRALEYDAGETKLLTAADIMGEPEDWPRFQAALASSGGVQAYEMTLRGRRGRELHFEVSAAVKRGPDGAAQGYQAIFHDITARKQMQQALELSEEKFAKAFRSSPVWMLLGTSDEDRLVEVNEAFLQATGFDRAEVLGRTGLELGLWVEPAERQAGLETLRRQGRLRGREVRRRTKDGAVLVMLWFAEVIDLGGAQMMLSIYLDISERQKAEAALQQSQERYRRMLEVSPDPIMVYDLAGRVTYANPAFCETFGWSLEEMLGREAPYVPETEKRQVEAAIASIASGRKIIAFDTQRLTKDGRLLSIQLSASCFHDAAGRPQGNLVILRDVTRHNQAVEALRESEEKYRLVVENANAAIFIGQDWRIKFPNPSLMDLTGYSRSELASQPYLSMVHEQDRELVRAMHERVFAGHNVAETRPFRIIRKNGEMRWATASSVPIVWDGQAASLSFVHDVTAHKQMEQQLLQAQKMEAIGRLAGGVAHDFNNLLLIIRGHSDLAAKFAGDDPRLRAQIAKIGAAGERGARLVKQLLTLSSHRAQEKGRVELNAVVQGLGELLHPLIPGNVALSISLAEHLEPALGDAAQIEQIIRNLVVNALDAMPEGGRLIIETCAKEVGPDHISQFMDLKPGRYALISVSDTGCGMDAETLGHIFEPFYTTKEAGKGTGLGLAVVYSTIKKLGGGLGVYSEPGQGTVFNVYLPPAGEAPPTEPPLPPPAARLGGSETILLAEDDPDVRDLIAESLSLSGYRVLEAADGHQAVELANVQPGPLDLVICDMVMPGLSGPQLVEQISALHPEAQVLFISGYTEAALPPSCLGQTGAGFLQKPFSIAELELKIREILGQPG
ncbi:MAG: PAS domain S-box protein [Pseudomonadota bacterium]